MLRRALLTILLIGTCGWCLAKTVSATRVARADALAAEEPIAATREPDRPATP